jgi:hypothetical protein
MGATALTVVASLCLPSGAFTGATLSKEEFDRQSARYRQEIEPLLSIYCYDCHGDGSRKGELALDSFAGIESMQQNRDVWKRIREHIDLRLMPPPDEDQPSEVERKQLVAWIDAAVFPIDPANPDPGRVLLRRLNREEYRNVIRDLLGVEVSVENILPPDDSGYSFDNIGDVLTLSPVHIERYLKAARQSLDMAVHFGQMPRPSIKIDGAKMEGPGTKSKEGHLLHSVGEAVSLPEITKPGTYRLHIKAGGTFGAGLAPKMELRVNEQLVQTWDVAHQMNQPGTYTHEIKIEQPGPHRIGITFPNDFYDTSLPDPAQRDRNLFVAQLSCEGPMEGPPLAKPETHRRIFGQRKAGQDDRAYSLEILTRFARKAFRRPVREGEVERYLPFLKVAADHGDDVEHGIRLALEAMLVSPSFIFREEAILDEEQTRPIARIDEHALATRLSFFLWSSSPDEELLNLAEAGKLREQLDSQIERMIRSPKSRRFVSNFGGQWLQLRNLVSAAPDNKRFPGFSGALAGDMRKETEMLFNQVLQENLPVSTLLDANYSFINERLATHYGIPDVKGNEFRKVSLEGTPRRGLLGHGAVLVVTSYPTRTSPVLRGKYVLENLLDISPPPPPPNVPQLGGGKNKDKSVREQLEIHREDPSCSTCHALMDPIGFGLENFDAVGAYRDSENGAPIDTTGTLADGASFANADELRSILISKHAADFQRAVATKLLTYALGRGLEWYDRPAIDGIVAEAAKDEARFQTFIRTVIHSVPFQYRRTTQPS